MVARRDVFNYVVLQMYPLAIKPTRSRRGSNFRQKPYGAKTHQSRVHARRNIRGVSALRSAFIDAAALGKTGTESPDALEADSACLAALEAIRQSASVVMGLAPDLTTAARIPSVPKVAMLSAPKAATTLSGRTLAANEMSILVRMISVGQPHRAVPITGATCLAIATRIEGSIPNALAAGRDGPIVIAHPSGVVMVDARVDHAHDAAKAHAVFGAVYRTMRKLFEGYVYYRPRAARSQVKIEAQLAAAVAAE
jgi:2-methylaconitate cis-trans-isomerase PrpF